MTLFDLDRLFHVHRSIRWNLELNFWWWGFVAINAGLATCCHLILQDQAPLSSYPAVVRGVLVGLGYLALVRLKFATVAIQGKEVALGLEPAYEGARAYFLKRINSIAMEATTQSSFEFAQSCDLQELLSRARSRINQNRLYTSEERRDLLSWVEQVATDRRSVETDRKVPLAYFILTGFR